MDHLMRRVGVLVEVADRKHGRQGRLGKTAMQKLLYLLQEFYGFELGYRFEFYTYGPYEAGVMRDIDYAEALGLLTVAYDHDQGYEIAPGPEAGDLVEERNEICQEAGEELDTLLDKFGSYNARELELRSTIVYVRKIEPSIDTPTLLEIVKELKPKYDDRELTDAIEEMEALEIHP